MAKPHLKEAPDGSYYIEIHVDTSEIDAATEKAERLLSTLEKAKSLAGDLAESEVFRSQNSD